MTETPLARLADARDQIIKTEAKLDDLKTLRDGLICDARREGATGDALAEASGVSRQTVHTVLRTHRIPAPNRTRATYDRHVRTGLARALAAAGIDLDDTTNPEDVGRAVADILRSAQED